VSWKYLFLAVHQEDADVTILRRKFFYKESVLCKQRDIFANNPKISYFCLNEITAKVQELYPRGLAWSDKCKTLHGQSNLVLAQQVSTARSSFSSMNKLKVKNTPILIALAQRLINIFEQPRRVSS